MIVPIHTDIEQNTEEWLDLRIGRVTASKASTVMANYGKAFGEPAKNYAVQIALEQIRGVRLHHDTYTNAHMQRGHEEEPIARQLYGDIYFCDVKDGGFVTLGDDLGASPDGLVGDHTIVEIKSGLPHVHYARMRRGKIDPAYWWQCIVLLIVTGRRHLHFAAYCADFPEDSRLLVYELDATSDEVGEAIAKFDTRMTEFRELISDIKGQIGRAAA